MSVATAARNGVASAAQIGSIGEEDVDLSFDLVFGEEEEEHVDDFEEDDDSVLSSDSPPVMARTEDNGTSNKRGQSVKAHVAIARDEQQEEEEQEEEEGERRRHYQQQQPHRQQQRQQHRRSDKHYNNSNYNGNGRDDSFGNSYGNYNSYSGVNNYNGYSTGYSYGQSPTASRRGNDSSPSSSYHHGGQGKSLTSLRRHYNSSNSRDSRRRRGGGGGESNRDNAGGNGGGRRRSNTVSDGRRRDWDGSRYRDRDNYDDRYDRQVRASTSSGSLANDRDSLSSRRDRDRRGGGASQSSSRYRDGHHSPSSPSERSRRRQRSQSEKYPSADGGASREQQSLTRLQQQAVNKVRENDRDKNAVLVMSERQFNITALIAEMERSVDKIRTYHYRDKQTFCFVQFVSAAMADKAVSVLNGASIEGVAVSVERVSRVTPGKDPRLDEASQEAEQNSTLVIKNLPFSLKQDSLKLVLNSYDVRPESVAFHHDASGMFRGMAFVKYATVADAVAIFDVINGMDVGGRPIRVEYKRRKESQRNVSQYDPTDAEMKRLYEQLMHFKNNNALNDLTFPTTLSTYQRRQIHLIADILDMDHYSQGDPDHRYLVISKRELVPVAASSSYSGGVGSYNGAAGGGGYGRHHYYDDGDDAYASPPLSSSPTRVATFRSPSSPGGISVSPRTHHHGYQQPPPMRQRSNSSAAYQQPSGWSSSPYRGGATGQHREQERVVRSPSNGTGWSSEWEQPISSPPSDEQHRQPPSPRVHGSRSASSLRRQHHRSPEAYWSPPRQQQQYAPPPPPPPPQQHHQGGAAAPHFPGGPPASYYTGRRRSISGAVADNSLNRSRSPPQPLYLGPGGSSASAAAAAAAAHQRSKQRSLASSGGSGARTRIGAADQPTSRSPVFSELYPDVQRRSRSPRDERNTSPPRNSPTPSFRVPERSHQHRHSKHHRSHNGGGQHHHRRHHRDGSGGSAPAQKRGSRTRYSQPVRQPTGPNGTRGFAEDYQKRRMSLLLNNEAMQPVAVLGK
jgi:R3H domain/RNA recognition motif/SUZ-C motif